MDYQYFFRNLSDQYREGKMVPTFVFSGQTKNGNRPYDKYPRGKCFLTIRAVVYRHGISLEIRRGIGIFHLEVCSLASRSENA